MNKKAIAAISGAALLALFARFGRYCERKFAIPVADPSVHPTQRLHPPLSSARPRRRPWRDRAPLKYNFAAQ